jgi:hypothetical protein
MAAPLDQWWGGGCAGISCFLGIFNFLVGLGRLGEVFGLLLGLRQSSRVGEVFGFLLGLSQSSRVGEVFGLLLGLSQSGRVGEVLGLLLGGAAGACTMVFLAAGSAWDPSFWRLFIVEGPDKQCRRDIMPCIMLW